MTFAGFVQLRRGIIEHLQDGRLSTLEFAVLVVLIQLADIKTGRGTINAPSLRAFVPELSYDAAKRILLSLEEKKYIFRQITPFSKRVYPFWVNNYLLTSGPRKSLQINLSQVFESKSITDIKYVKPPLDGAPEGALEGALDPALHYKKEIDTEKKKDPIRTKVSASLPDSLSHTQSAAAKHTMGEACAPHEAHTEAHTLSHAEDHTLPVSDLSGLSLEQLKTRYDYAKKNGGCTEAAFHLLERAYVSVGGMI